MDVEIVGTENYFNNWSRTDPVDHLFNCREFIDDLWERRVNDPDDNYEMTPHGWSDSFVEVPEAAIADSSTSQRHNDIDAWLDYNWDRYSDAACAVVLDWYENSDSPAGRAFIGRACRNPSWNNRAGWVNAYYDDPSPYTYFHSATRSQGTAFHELQHLFDVRHEHGAIYSTGNSSSMVTSGSDEDWCSKDNSRDRRQDFVAICARGVQRDHIDDVC